MADLGTFQRNFGRALLDVPGSSRALVSKPFATALTIHRNTAIKGLVDALSANYPTVHRLVGDEWFRATAIEYVRSYPPQSPILALYGEIFPAFLAAFEPAADLPYLSEVARIDRMWIEALMAPDAPALASSSLASLDMSALPEQRIAFHPATRFAWVRHSAATIWIHHRAAEPAALEIADAGEGILLTRREGTVAHTLLDAPAFTFLKSLGGGASLETAAAAALQLDTTADVARTLAQSIVAGAFANLTGSHS